MALEGSREISASNTSSSLIEISPRTELGLGRSQILGREKELFVKTE